MNTNEVHRALALIGIGYLGWITLKCPCKQLFSCAQSKAKFFGTIAAITAIIFDANLHPPIL
jgi:hypothetical protein